MVVVIIGILLNYAVLTLRSSSPMDQLKEESLRLKSLLVVASEEALLRSSLIGVDISETGYAFLRLEEQTWQPLNDTLFRNRELPEELRITLTTAQSPEEDEEGETHTPEIILLNSGEITPFELKISSIHSDDYYRLSGVETGELTLDRVKAY